MGNKKPKPEDFSESNINKAVISEAIQHPATLFSAALSILSGIYMGMIDFSKPALAVTIGSGVFSLMSYIYNYFFKGEKLAEKYTSDLLKQRVQYKQENAENVKKKCEETVFNDGLKAYNELFDVYKRLSGFLKEKAQKKKTYTISKFLILADETFYGGISLIEKGAILYKAIREMHEGKLENELNNWINEANSNKIDRKERALLKSRINNHRKRLSLLKKKKTTLKEIMNQVEILEATLDSTYLEVLDLLESDSLISGDRLVSDLEKAVKSARKVENRLRTNKKKDDEMYER